MSLPAPLSVAEASLSARLKSATRELHTQAERSGVMQELLCGRIEWPAYLALMRNLRTVYASLEAGLDRRPPSAASAGLWNPALRRLPALDQDLAHWAATPREGPGRQPIRRPVPAPGSPPAEAPVPAAGHYAARLQALADHSPELLLAHAYVRYLGDLHGGQVLSRLVRKHFTLPEGAGTSFYEFGEPCEVERLRAEFRSALDALPLLPQQAAAFIEEACEGFRLHRQMFEQIQAQHTGA